MIDPFTAFAAANAAFNGIKRAVEVGKEAQEVYMQLSHWAGALSDLQEAIHQKENRKPGLFEKIGFEKNEAREAFDTFIAKQKIIEMEREIYNMFLYGNLQHLGIDGYREFVSIKKGIKAKREKMIYEQLRARAKFARRLINIFYTSIAVVLFGFLIFLITSVVLYSGNSVA